MKDAVDLNYGGGKGRMKKKELLKAQVKFFLSFTFPFLRKKNKIHVRC